MASQPTLAWVLLLSLLASCLPAAQPRDFTVKDIVYLHPSSKPPLRRLQSHRQPQHGATPYPHGFKCFTCEKAADNYECNRWAPDVYCPRDTRYCFSQHMMKVTGESVSVTKRCVPLEDCLYTGCTYVKHEGYKICTSCCEGSICNLPLPKNTTDAVFTTLSPLNKTQRLSHPALLTAACLWLGFISQHWVVLPGPGS
ncbi:ly6/PLAUR domain-containing protein 6 isoform X2 [Lathamus discolor]|uniref:ly6/PLAUR domain-containing protein 6 isoform X2 n=1 Tax=Lathamus discolor TaxID=678569 RepID=UPI0032B71E48